MDVALSANVPDTTVQRAAVSISSSDAEHVLAQCVKARDLRLALDVANQLQNGGTI